MKNLRLTQVDPIDRDYFPEGGFFITFNLPVPIRMAQQRVQEYCNDLLTGFPFSGPHTLNFGVRYHNAEPDARDTPNQPPVAPTRPPYEACVWRTPIEGTPVISIGNEGRMSSVWEMVCDTSGLDEDKVALISRIVHLFEEMHTRLTTIAGGN